MAKQLNVNLAFTADTSQAKAQVQELQATLNQIAYAGNSATGMNKQTQAIQQASAAAKELQLHLNNAFDTTTGRFDLSKLDKSLKTSGSNIGDLATKLAGAGQTGQQAFAQLAQSIASANQPMFILNSKLAEMWTVMKNTMRWQLSSSMIHGFMGTVQQAYGYVQDLNESLNNIRIVTGYSSEEMAVFAKEANKAAKALSTTTTEYTDASLIYYQQGLSDAEVKERTDVTIKMANAAGQSAQIVSDQMTAVWNNFDDGSKSLEYHADVMTALGAATASSTDEIAAGLEKFAAIAETVGLSYEYSTAALATITANTRQSADVVGNALKTLFARIQGLSLGETLEDGVDLNKYSSALASVGVQVLNSNGELREMDDILDDLATKWDTLGKAEQTALAQTVAGVRQYTQLVALMDNWDDMKINLDVAYNAEGTLDEQQKIYEESWQASIDRVKAASEGIYDSLLNDDFFIGLNNGFAEVLGGVELFIDGIGGAKGAIIALSTILISSLSHKIPQAIDNLVYNFKFLTKGANEAYKSIQNDMNSAFDKTKEQFYVKDNAGIVQNDKEGQPILNSTGTAIKYANELTAARTKLVMVSKTMSNAERQLAEMELSLIEADQQRVVSLKQKNEELQRSIQITNNSYKDSIEQKMDDAGQMALNTEGIGTNLSNFLSTGDYASKMREAGISMAKQITEGMMSQGQEFNIRVSEIYSAPFEKLQNFKSINIDESNYQKVAANISALIKTMDEGTQKTLGLDKVLKTLGKDNLGIKDVEKALNDTINKMAEGTIDATNYQRTLKALFGEKKGQVLIEQFEQLKANGASTDEIMKRLKETMAGFNPVHIVRTSEALGAMAGMAGTAAMAINSIKSLISTLENPDASGWEKLSAILMTFSMIVPGITSGIKNIGTITSWASSQSLVFASSLQKEIAAKTNNIIITNADTAATEKSKRAKMASAGASLLEKAGIDAKTKVTIKGKTVTLGYALAEAIAEKGSLKAGLAAIAGAKGIDTDTAAKLRNLKVSAGLALTWGKLLGIMALIGVAVFVATKVVDHFVVTQKEASEAISSANEAYEEEQGKLEDLNSELETTRDRIKELQALDSLTIVEQTELNKLKQSEASLERQIELQERLASLKRQEAANEIAENWEKSVGNIGDEDTAEIYEFDKIGLSPADQAHQESLGRTGYTKAEAEAYVAAKRKEYESAQDVSQLDFTLEDLEGWESYIDTAYSKEYADEALPIMENFQTLQDMYNEAKEAGDDKGAQDILDIISNMTSSDQFSKAMEVTYGDDYEKEVLGGFVKENIDIRQLLNIADGKDVTKIVGKDSLALAGINADDLSSYISNEVQKLKEENGLTDEQIISLTPEQLLTLIENQSDLDGVNLEELGTGEELKNYVNGIQKKTLEQIKEEADSKGISQAESYGLDVEEFKAQRDLIYETTTELEKMPEMVNEVAVAHERYYQGAEKLSEVSKNYGGVLTKLSKELKKGGTLKGLDSKTLKSLGTSIEDIKDGMADLFDISKDNLDALDPEDIVENWEDLEKAFNGDTDAYNRLQAVIAKKNIAKIMGVDTLPEDISTAIDTISQMEGYNLGDIIKFDGDAKSAELASQIQRVAMQAASAAYAASGNMAEAVSAYNAVLSQFGVVATPKLIEERYTVTVETPDGFHPEEDGSWTDPVTGQRYAGVKFLSSDGVETTFTATRLVSEGTEEGGYVVKDMGNGGGGGTNNNSGGGGGGAKHADKKNDSDKERYHTIKNQLEDISKEYESISEAADRAFGKDKLDLIDQQIAKTDEYIDKQEELVEALEKDLKADQAIMTEYYSKVIGGNTNTEIKFDERGNISNFDEIQDAMWSEYNRMAETYDQDSQEWQIFEQEFEQWEKYLEQYEKTHDELNDARAEAQELINQKLDLELQKIQYQVELEIDVSDDSLSMLDYQLSKIEDDAFKAAESIALIGKQADLLYQKMMINRDGLKDILSLTIDSESTVNQILDGKYVDLSGYNFTEDQISALKEYRDNLLDANEQMAELRDTVQEKLSDAFDAWNEKVQKGIDGIEHYGSVIEHYGNIIDTVGQEFLGVTDDLMASLNQSSVDNAIANLTAVKNQYEAIESARKNAEDKLNNAKTEEDIKFWQEQLDTLTEESRNAVDNVLSAWEEALSSAVSAFEASVERAMNAFNMSVYADGGLEGLGEDFERQKKLSDMYLQDYKQIYELSKLNRDINNSIDDTKSLAGKQKLKKLLEEINDIQESGLEMSEYDLEYLQAEYDLRLAEIALEEAQNAKDTVRLQKDNEGNWSYIYTSSTDAVDEAQQKYEDALYAMQDLSSNYINEMSDQLIQTSQEMAEELANLRIEDFASIDDYYTKVKEIQDSYAEEMALQEGELNKAIANNKELYDTDWTNYHNATGYKISDTEEFVTRFSDSMLGLLMGSEEESSVFADFINNAAVTLTESLKQNALSYEENIKNAMNAAGTSLEDFANQTETYLGKVQQATATAAGEVNTATGEMKQGFADLSDEIVGWQNTYGAAADSVIAKNEELINSMNKLLTALSIDEDDIMVDYTIKTVPAFSEEDIPEEASAATGGYTGDWAGNSGRLALLHKRELILDDNDTSNFVTALGLTKDILQVIDLNAKQASLAYGPMTASTLRDEATQMLEQSVHITAEFPNVQDKNEIQEAFNNLINTASQYANRK